MTATDLPVCVRIIIKGCFLEKKKKKNLFLSSSIYCEVNHLSSYRECIVVLCCCCYKCLLLSLRWLLSSASCPLPSHPPPPEKNRRVWDLTGGQRGLLQQNQTSVSRVAAQKLVVSTCLTFSMRELKNTRVRSCRDLEKQSSVPQSLLEPLVSLLGS